MFCRRISSCILLVIIVLSVTRTPIIASAATAVASNNIEALLSNQWETLSPIFETLKEYFNESSEPLIQQLCDLLITRIPIITAPAEVSSPDDVQDFVTALTGFSSQIKRLLKLKHNSQVSITLNAKLFTRVILWLLIFPQNDRVNEIINELIRELNDPELVQEVMKYLTMAMTEDASDLSAPIWNLMNKLFFHAKKFGHPAGWLGTLFRISQYEKLSELQKKEAIYASTTLDSHVLSPDNAARIIPCLHFALKYTELSTEEKTEAIDALITLVTIVTSPDEAACIFFCLDFALVRLFMATLFPFNLNDCTELSNQF